MNTQQRVQVSSVTQVGTPATTGAASEDDALFGDTVSIDNGQGVGNFDGDEGDGGDGGESGIADFGDATEDESSEMGILEIHSRKCLRCTHLCPELEGNNGKAFTNCHFENGNEDCPAATVQIVVGIPVNRLIRTVFECEASNDSERLATLYARIATKDAVVQAQFFAALQAARADSKA